MKGLVVGILIGCWCATAFHKVEVQTDLVAKVKKHAHPVRAPRAYWSMPDDGLSLGYTVAFQEVNGDE